MSALRSWHRRIRTTKIRLSRSSHTNTLIPNIIRHRDLNLGQILLHLHLHHVLHKHPALPLKLPMPTINNPQNTLPQRLLNLPHQPSNLVHQLRLDIVPKPSIRRMARAGVAIELCVERVSAEDFLEGTLELVG